MPDVEVTVVLRIPSSSTPASAKTSLAPRSATAALPGDLGVLSSSIARELPAALADDGLAPPGDLF